MHNTQVPEGDHREEMTLNQVWRACRKIQGAIFRYNYDICADFKEHDPTCSGFISESLFTCILGKYGKVCGLSEFELRDVTDYFQIRDGRIAYRQFCKVVCSEDLNKNASRDIVTGLEWNDPYHLNVLAHGEDRRKLCMILLKIAQESHLPLMPYFQDYELISKNIGVVTVSHFSRVLHFMKIQLSDEDFLLLLRRYMKDSYLVNYVAFMQHINNIIDYLKEHHIMDINGKLFDSFPGHLVELDLSQLPPLNSCKIVQPIFPDICNHHQKNTNQCDVIFCVQNYILKNRVRCSEFLECFDQLRIGSITKNQFERGLHNMGVGKHLSQREFEELADRYVDPVDTNRIRWRRFVDEIDTVFTIKNLEKMPECVVESPLKHIVELPRKGAVNWLAVPKDMRELCDEAMEKISLRVRNRRLFLHPFFRNYDKLNHGHVLCNQANQIFRTNGILLSDRELEAVLHRYGNELGFHYTKFMDDIDPDECPYAMPCFQDKSQLKDCPPFHRDKDKPEYDSEENIVRILTEARRQVHTRGIGLMEFLTDYDHHREGEILEADFKRALHSASVILEEEDTDAICKVFRSNIRSACVRYRDFVNALNEVFIQMDTQLDDNVVSTVPLLHLVNLDCIDCFLNFDERVTCSKALMKLARKPDEISNLKQVFKDFDRVQCGCISKNQFLRGLTLRDMHTMISSRELKAVVKCFGVKRGLYLDFNYREFLNILDLLFKSGQVKRNF